ncbi:MAG: hypothetical protein IIY21_15770 [Clostridiales bacterium]|nr:hypothetical protein [Clostridiales bacterium]
MPKISNLPSVISLDLNDVFAVVSKDNDNNDTTMKATVSALANKLNNNIQYAALNTSNDTIVGAINELEARSTYTEVTGTLLTGATSITLSDASITTTSTIDIYTDVFGIQPTNAVVATGSITLTFLAQASDITVKVRVS